jgi:hypothetical protein
MKRTSPPPGAQVSYTPPMYIALATNNKEPQPKRHKWIPKLLSSCSYHASRNQRMGTILLKYLDLIMNGKYHQNLKQLMKLSEVQQQIWH